jgi:hypothetical protein
MLGSGVNLEASNKLVETLFGKGIGIDNDTAVAAELFELSISLAVASPCFLFLSAIRHKV